MRHHEQEVNPHMEQITIDTLLTVTGVTLVVGIILQGIKVAYSSITGQWLRRLALGLGVVLMVAMAATSGIEPGVNVVAFYLVAAINGIIAGLAAGAAFDTIKYGDSRTITGS